MTLIEFLIMALAVFRLSSLLADERGPYGVFSRLRLWAGEVILRDNTRSGTNEFARGLVCTWCNSVWLGVMVGVGYYFQPYWVLWGCLPLALSGAAVVVNSAVGE